VELFYCRRDGSLGIATKVFQTTDFSGQHYFCYLIPYRHHLRSAAVIFILIMWNRNLEPCGNFWFALCLLFICSTRVQ